MHCIKFPLKMHKSLGCIKVDGIVSGMKVFMRGTHTGIPGSGVGKGGGAGGSVKESGGGLGKRLRGSIM